MGKDLGISIEEKVHRIKAYLDETLTPEEEAEFRRWLSASVANRVLLDRIRDERILLNKIRFSKTSKCFCSFYALRGRVGCYCIG